MDYQRQYNWLISQSFMTPRAGFCERHHIIPACLGGNDSDSNLVMLTAREHFLAHVLLARIHGGNRLWYAVIVMKSTTKNSKLYAIARKEHANALRGKPRTQEVRDKMRASQQVAQNKPETRAKRSATMKGVPKTQETKDRMRAAWARRKSQSKDLET